jgi:PQQ-dependent catabolism-associated CXXCW motif protein
MKKLMLLSLLYLFLANSVYAKPMENPLDGVEIENLPYDIENQEWREVKPTFKLRKTNFHAGTPVTHPAAKTISTYQLLQLLKRDNLVTTINSLNSKNDVREVIYGGYWIDNIGGFGAPYRKKLEKALGEIIKNKDDPIVFYCQSAKCWVSYNAALHAAKLGYNNLYWFRGGIDAWKDAGLPISKVSRHQIAKNVSLNELLKEVEIENKPYDIEDKNWKGIKPTLNPRREGCHAGTPQSHPFAKTLTTVQLYELLKKERDILTINALGGDLNRREVIYGGYWVSGIGGAYESHKDKMSTVLQQLLPDKTAPFIVYCLSAKCWSSYNAVTHAIALGYSNVYWFRGGIDAWKDASLPTQTVTDFKQAGDRLALQ